MSELEHIADVAPMVSGSERVEAECIRCDKPFAYEKQYAQFLGRPVFALPIRRVCDACEHEEFLEEEREEARQAFERAMNRYSRGDRGSRLAHASFASFVEGDHNRGALTTAKAWMDESTRPNLLLVGPIGSGKSFLAACIHNALLAALQPAYWLNAGALVVEIRRGFGDRDAAARANDRMECASTAPVLVLDDLGKVHPGKDVSWVEETFYTIVEARYRDELPTIVTTEWKSAALAERVGQSVVSRLEDGAWVAGIKQPATAYRKAARV